MKKINMDYGQVLAEIVFTDEGANADRFNMISSAINLAANGYADTDIISNALNDALNL